MCCVCRQDMCCVCRQVWCRKPDIYELFLRFWTQTWDAWCWKPIFRENVPTTLIFTRFGSRRGTRNRIHRIHRIQQIQRIQRKWSTAGSSHPRLLAPEARMTVVKQTPSNDFLRGISFLRKLGQGPSCCPDRLAIYLV